MEAWLVARWNATDVTRHHTSDAIFTPFNLFKDVSEFLNDTRIASGNFPEHEETTAITM